MVERCGHLGRSRNKVPNGSDQESCWMIDYSYARVCFSPNAHKKKMLAEALLTGEVGTRRPK